MRMAWDLLLPEKPKPEPPPVTTESETINSYQNLIRFLKSSMALSRPAVFSSNNSLLSCYSYGDIYDFIRITQETLEALMLDQSYDFESWVQKRTPTLIRSIFVTSNGEFPDVEKTLQELRWVTLRLAEGYEMRKQHLDLGMYVYQNLYAADFLLKDLDSFFTELFHEYRDTKLRQETTDLRRGG